MLATVLRRAPPRRRARTVTTRRPAAHPRRIGIAGRDSTGMSPRLDRAPRSPDHRRYRRVNRRRGHASKIPVH